MIALRKEIFEELKKELMYLGLIFIIALVSFKIAFFKESTAVLLRNVLSLFWLFALPGYSIMFYWHEKLSFLERFIVGFMIAAAVIGIFSYYFGLLGINVKFHAFALPLILILVGIVINFRK